MRELLRTKSKYQVFVTSDTIRGIMLEASRHPKLECIVHMPGVRRGNKFYFDMPADSGMNAVYEYGMCVKDHAYVDHLCTRISEYYDIPQDALTVSQVHKHPPGYDRFSPGDSPVNQSLARQFGGVVNGLILVNPDFRLKFWYIDEGGREERAPYVVNDTAVREAMPKKRLRELKSLVERQEATDEREDSVGRIEKMRGLLFQWFAIGESGKKEETDDGNSLLKELDELSYETDIHVNKSGKQEFIFSALDSGGDKQSVRMRVRENRLYITDDEDEKMYSRGDLGRMLGRTYRK